MIDAPQPIERITENINRTEVGKTYLKAELAKFFRDANIQELIDEAVDRLEGDEFWRLLRAWSDTYRMNAIHRIVSDEQYFWNCERWPIGELKLTGINRAVNSMIEVEGIGGNPLKFGDFLRRYFADHAEDDPRRLDEFRPTGKEIRHRILTLIEEDGEIRVIDGAHRLISMVLAGDEEIVGLIGRKQFDEASPH